MRGIADAALFFFFSLFQIFYIFAKIFKHFAFFCPFLPFFWKIAGMPLFSRKSPNVPAKLEVIEKWYPIRICKDTPPNFVSNNKQI